MKTANKIIINNENQLYAQVYFYLLTLHKWENYVQVKISFNFFLLYIYIFHLMFYYFYI